ncbi:uncharacterized protein SPPG_05962 [Spizellomyces punctatus DAOM BR117]|uniref:Uncharacterized protein n=1 Tax=Spizellomyces punctatus (strain DAOM BR117) TaxID=645134 RepID=A0A0L0HCZ2_SPIPD|nr:uncharacterized protein SPPG_05962 [Spizellomyces punctatus DAOM BR117]KNC99012.1 hypothetical protein SPPG_05962 [Spizellomyces punctatus DAOM BR117]|eukprot:XP_016607052.1 hypothetical protein SPPG_05962 [Spizellomyces punctatus DAOM BR117]
MARRTLVSLCAGIAALAAFASASDSSAPYASLHLYPRLTDGAPRDISWTQATSLVSHVVAVSAGAGDILQPVNILEVQDNEILDDAVKDIKFDILGAPKANLWVVIDDYHAESGLVDSVPYFRIYTEHNTADAQLVDFGERAARAIVKNVPGSWPLIISSKGQGAVTGQVSAVHVGEKRVDVSTQAKLPASIRKTLTAISETLYEDMKSHAIEKFGESAQSLNSNNPEDMHLMAELEFATSLIEAFKVQRVASAGKPIDVPSFIAVTFSGLSSLRDRYGEKSAQYENGAKMVNRAISEMVSSFTELHDGHVLAEVLTVPPKISRTLLSRRASTTATPCPTTVAECISTFSNCTNHGTCGQRNGSSCFVCQCGNQYTDDAGQPRPGFSGPVKWTGDACQYQDITVPFQIIFWTSLVLIITIIFVVGLLSSVGSVDSANDGAGSGTRSKTD